MQVAEAEAAMPQEPAHVAWAAVPGTATTPVPTDEAHTRFFPHSSSAQPSTVQPIEEVVALVPTARARCPLRGSSPALSRAAYFGAAPAL